MVKKIMLDKEINELLEEVFNVTSLSTLQSISEYIEYAKKQNLTSRYFPILNCGFIVYNDEIIYLTAEEGSTTLSIKPMCA